MIMVIYLLTALFLGGFGNYLIPLMCGSRDMVFPYLNMLSYWVYLLSVIILLISFFVPGGSTGAGWTLVSTAGNHARDAGRTWGILLMLLSLVVFIVAFTMGGLNYVTTVAAGALPRHDADAHAVVGLGHFHRDDSRLAGVPGTARQRHHDVARQDALRTSFFMPAISSMGVDPGAHRRQPDPVPAPVLVLRSSGGLHRCVAGLRYRF